MNAKRINALVETLFQGGFEGEPPEPLNKRFNWVDPKTGKRPPEPPKEMLPGASDFADDAAPGVDINPGDLQSAPPVRDMTDRVGKHSMNDLIPPNEMATVNDLLDQYLARQRSHGPEKAKQWFDAYRTAEFESAVSRLVNAILESHMPGDYCPKCEGEMELLSHEHQGAPAKWQCKDCGHIVRTREKSVD